MESQKNERKNKRKESNISVKDMLIFIERTIVLHYINIPCRIQIWKMSSLKSFVDDLFYFIIIICLNNY